MWIIFNFFLLFQHEAGRAAFEDAQKQMADISGSIETKSTGIAKVQSEIEKSKLEGIEARKEEQVCIFIIEMMFDIFIFKLLLFISIDVVTTFSLLQEYIREQEALIPSEQAARQKVAELKSVLDSERNQGTVLKAILHAKESNRIKGIHGRMGDLGAIDGECSAHCG